MRQQLRRAPGLLVAGALLLVLAAPTLAGGPPDTDASDTTDAPDATDVTDASDASDAPDAPDAPDAHHHPGHDPHEPENIIVTATPIEHDRDELAVPVDKLDRREILDRLGATLGETLATRPGIATTGFSGGASRPVIRGQDAFRTEVTEDGIATQDVSRESPDHAVPVNPLSVERIEVVRGPATLRYGGGASAGVVNAITNRVPDVIPDEPVTGEIFGAIDAVANRRDVAIDVNGGRGPFAYHGDLLLRRTDDYEIPSGGRQNGTFVDAFSGSAGVSYLHEDTGRIGAAYSRFESEYGIPEADENVEIELDSNRVHFEGDWSPRGELAPAAIGSSSLPSEGTWLRQLRLRGAYTNYEHKEKAEGIVGQIYENDQFDGRLELLHDGVLGFIGAVGVTGRWRDFKARGEAAEFLAPSNTKSAALYLFEERELLTGLVAELGFRLEGTIVEGTPAGGGKRERPFIPVSGSLGLVYEASEALSFGLMGAASQRAPAEVELFARGPHEATGTFELGNPSLDEETSYTGELRVTFGQEGRRLEVAGFVTHYKDYIFGELTGNTVDEEGNPVAPTDPEALDELLYRDRNATFAGTEVFAQSDLFDALWGTFGVDAQMDFVRARFSNGPDRDVPRIPPIRWGMNLYYRGEWLNARVGFFRTEQQEDVPSTLTPTDDFTFLNAELSVLLTPVGNRVPVELAVFGTNLTDEPARNVVSFNADEIQLPGRNVRGTLRVRF